MSDVPHVKTNVRKLVIVPYTDKNFQTQNKAVGHFAVPINPESYSENYKVDLDTRTGSGEQSTGPRYKRTEPASLKLEFTLDGTGAVEGNVYHKSKEYQGTENLSVYDQVQKLLKTAYYMDGDIHRPSPVKVFWGELKFPGVLSSIDIKYTLFDEEGKPLRAKVSATFREYQSAEVREATQNKKSPDLTHKRVVKGGDRLDLMTHDIYGDSNLFMQVAKANKMTSLRNVKPGKKILFPPLDKTEV